MYAPILLATIVLSAAWLLCTALVLLQPWTKLDVKTSWIIVSILVAPFLLLHLLVEILIVAGVFKYASPLPRLSLTVLSCVAILWIGWFAFGMPYSMRKRIRRDRIRRGLCPKCAYDLRGAGKEATVCPECGAASVAKYSYPQPKRRQQRKGDEWKEKPKEPRA